MGETINLLFRNRENGTYEVQIKENTSGRIVTGNFVPPYTGRQLTALQKKLNTLDSGYQELREIGYRLFRALCDVEENGKSTSQRETSEPSVRAVLRTTIQR